MPTVNLCPNESDARAGAEAYITDPEVLVLAGYQSDGIEGLTRILMEELAEVEPDSKTILLNRDTMCDNDITFAKDLEGFLAREVDDSVRTNIIVQGDPPVMNWAVPIMAYKGRNVQLHCVSLSCKFVPMVLKRF